MDVRVLYTQFIGGPFSPLKPAFRFTRQTNLKADPRYDQCENSRYQSPALQAAV